MIETHAAFAAPPAKRKSSFGPLIAVALAVIGGAGCARFGAFPPPAVSTGETTGVLDEQAARRELRDVERMIDEGEHWATVPRLLLLVSRYPASDAALDARWLLGATYERVGSYKDAMDMFTDYLRLAPKGPHAEQCIQQLERINEKYEQEFLSLTEIDAQVRTLETKLREQPDALVYQWELADLLWKRGNYDEAGRLYERILANHPQYARDPVLARRVELLPDGRVIVLTPAEIERRQIERRPLEIINQNAFRSGRELFTREHRYYVVTGQVLNRSDSVLYGVEVDVTLFGFGNVVFDTSTVYIGRMSPGELRAFSVRFSKFENIENISKYESVARFQR